jgi:hypothetical protein
MLCHLASSSWCFKASHSLPLQGSSLTLEDEGNAVIWYIRNHLPRNTASNPRSPEFLGHTSIKYDSFCDFLNLVQSLSVLFYRFWCNSPCDTNLSLKLAWNTFPSLCHLRFIPKHALSNCFSTFRLKEVSQIKRESKKSQNVEQHYIQTDTNTIGTSLSHTFNLFWSLQVIMRKTFTHQRSSWIIEQ